MRLVGAFALLGAVFAAPRARGGEPVGLSVTFTNPFDHAMDLFWVSGETTASMGTIQADYGELVMNTFPGHAFGWRAAVTDAEECTTDDLLGTVDVVNGMQGYELGGEVSFVDGYEVDPSEVRDAPWDIGAMRHWSHETSAST
ncbi:hypothetical protein M885DRAFT_486631 [Pelagophyceae sp. CCMP2097]|nr:hypothetical protein M885DRAFT_486631 [Pelagophyceae sp. CCMP2097]